MRIGREQSTPHPPFPGVNKAEHASPSSMVVDSEIRHERPKVNSLSPSKSTAFHLPSRQTCYGTMFDVMAGNDASWSSTREIVPRKRKTFIRHLYSSFSSSSRKVRHFWDRILTASMKRTSGDRAPVDST